MGPGALVERPGCADLSRTKRSLVSEVIGSVEEGDGDAHPMMVNSEVLVGKCDSYEVNRKALA